MVPETAFLCRAYCWVFLETEFSEIKLILFMNLRFVRSRDVADKRFSLETDLIKEEAVYFLLTKLR